MEVLIKDLPQEVHEELVLRADASDMSLCAYLRMVLSDHVAVPSMDEWLQRARDLGPVPASDQTGPGRGQQTRGRRAAIEHCPR